MLQVQKVRDTLPAGLKPTAKSGELQTFVAEPVKGSVVECAARGILKMAPHGRQILGSRIAEELFPRIH